MKGNTTMSYFSKSSSKNKAFAKDVNALVMQGVSPAVAKNIVRWKWSNWKPGKTKDFKYGLTTEQLTPPSARLAMKVANGTQAGLPLDPLPESVKWQHVMQSKAGVLYDRRTQGEFALDCYI